MDDDSSWLGIGPGATTGFAASDLGAGGVTSGLQGAAQTAAGSHPPLWSPDNPLFWFAALLAVAGGLIVVSTSVKAGPLKAKASV